MEDAYGQSYRQCIRKCLWRVYTIYLRTGIQYRRNVRKVFYKMYKKGVGQTEVVQERCTQNVNGMFIWMIYTNDALHTEGVQYTKSLHEEDNPKYLLKLFLLTDSASLFYNGAQITSPLIRFIKCESTQIQFPYKCQQPTPRKQGRLGSPIQVQIHNFRGVLQPGIFGLSSMRYIFYWAYPGSSPRSRSWPHRSWGRGPSPIRTRRSQW